MRNKILIYGMLVVVTALSFGCGEKATTIEPQTKEQAIEIEKARRDRELNDIRESRN